MVNRRRLEIAALDGVPTISPGDDLVSISLSILASNSISLEDGDVLVYAQKVISKAEGRAVALSSVTPSQTAHELSNTVGKDPRLVELILRESVEVLRCRPGVIIVQNRYGLVLANAGIDASNVEEVDNETVLLLPVNPDETAMRVRTAIHAQTGKTVAVIINDSIGRAWRLGTCGTAIGTAGLPALLDLRGQLDRNGRPLQTSELAVADEIAAAASLMMGQAGEGYPIVHLRGVPYSTREGKATDLVRPKNMDLFR